MRPTVASLVAASIIVGAGVPVAGGQIEDVQIIQGPGVPSIVRDPTVVPRPQVPAGTAIIAGIVVSADGGRPVRRATVRLTGLTAAPPLVAQADEQGRFSFTNLPAGRFTITAAKPGYLDSIFGQRRPGSGRPGTPLSVADGQRVDRLSVPLARGGVLAGTVTDDAGEPAFGTTVRAYRYVWDSGERAARFAAEVKTDDRGQYRIGALPPGDYVITATPPGSPGQGDVVGLPFNAAFRVEGPRAAMAVPPVPIAQADVGGPSAPADTYAPVFFPGALSGQNATVVALDIGEERGGLDVQMPFVSTGRIAGVVMHQGQPAGSVQVQVESVDDTLSLHGQMTVTGPDGSFVLSNLPPGRYRVDARTGPQRRVQIDQANGQTRVMMQFTSAAPAPGGGGMPPPEIGAMIGPLDQRLVWAGTEVTVSGSDTQRVTLSLEPGVTVSGRVVFDGSGQVPSNLNSITIALNATGPRAGGSGSSFGRVGPDGRFTITDVLPGRYRPVVLAGAWRAKRFEIQGQDALDTLVDIQPGREVPEAAVALTTRMGSVSGTLSDAMGQPAADYTIILFSEEQADWAPRSRRISATRPATDGRFTLTDLPAGRYRMAAVEDVDDGQWFDPALLRQLSASAIPIDVADAGAPTQDIRLAR